MPKPSFILDDFCLAPRQPVVRSLAHIGCKKSWLLPSYVVTNRYCRVFEYGADSNEVSDHWRPGQS